jgi:hypothetical protein
MRYRDILNEISFRDAYPRPFSRFYDRYAALASRRDIYVNFTDAVGNTLDKSFSPRPNHGDPSGLYAYPLNYVIDHPMDIQYGQQARYLRVIQDVSSNKLVLQDITWTQLPDLLSRMGATEPMKLIGQAKRQPHLAASAGRVFFWCMQYYLTVGQKTRASNAEQTALLRRAGFDAVEDRARSSVEAIIYPDEPEQIIFLKRSAFKVIDVEELRSQQSAAIYRSDPSEGLKRLPAMVAVAIGDKLTVSAAAEGDERLYYTAGKRKIVVRLDGYDFGFGHRSRGTAGAQSLEVRLTGPDFEPIAQLYPAGTTFEFIAADIKEKFDNRVAADGSGQTREGDYGPVVEQTIKMLAMVAARLKVPFTPPAHPEVAFRMWKATTEMGGIGRFKTGKERFDMMVIGSIEKNLGSFKNRPPQADQMIAIFKAVYGNRKVAAYFANLPEIVRKLGLVVPDVETPEEASVVLGDGVAVSRDGTALKITMGDRSFDMAKIDRSKLSDWKDASEGGYFDQDRMLPHAKALVDYLNKNNFYTDGYSVFLAENYGIAYRDQKWHVVEDVAEREVVNGLTIWTIPDGRGWIVGADIRGEKSFENWGPEWKGKTARWRTMEILFWLNETRTEITNLGSNTQKYLSWKDGVRKDTNPTWMKGPSYETLFGNRERGGEIWKQIESSGFDPAAYIKKKGYGFSARMEDDLELFGLKANKDNDKIGETFEEIAKPVGEFAGKTVYSLVVKTSKWESLPRHYIFIEDGKLVQALRTERDSIDGKKDTKVIWISEKLSSEQRASIAALISDKGIPMTKKFAPLLSRKRA